jgi:hypothetical protein
MTFTKQTPRNFFASPVEIEETEQIELCHECNHEAELITHFDAMLQTNIQVCAECLEVVKDAELNVN